MEWPNWIFGLKLAMSSTKGFLADFGALICPEEESARCHAGTLGQFFLFKIIGVNRDKNKLNGGKTSKVSKS